MAAPTVVVDDRSESLSSWLRHNVSANGELTCYTKYASETPKDVVI